MSSALCICGISVWENPYGGCISEPGRLQLRVLTSGRRFAPWAKREVAQKLQPVCPKSHSTVICQRIQSRKHIKVGSPEQLCLTCGPLIRSHANIFIESLANCAWILNRVTPNKERLTPPPDWLFLHLQVLTSPIPLSQLGRWSEGAAVVFPGRDLSAPITGASMYSQTRAWFQIRARRRVHACLLITRVACNLLLLILLKHVSLQFFLCQPPKFLFIKPEAGLSLISLTSNCRQAWRVHTY